MTTNPAPEPNGLVITDLTAAEQTAFVTTVLDLPSVSARLRQATQSYLAKTTDRPEGSRTGMPVERKDRSEPPQ